MALLLGILGIALIILGLMHVIPLVVGVIIGLVAVVAAAAMYHRGGLRL
jgi:hypothetical protein